MEMVWVTILSKVANEDKNAQLEQDPTLKFEEIPEEELDNYVNPPLEIELTREKEQPNNSQLSFELPKQALGACWPLLAMWPVLYGETVLDKVFLQN